MDREHLEEQLQKDYKLLKELEDRQRIADDPKLQEKLRIDIKELKQLIEQRKAELNTLQNRNSLENIKVSQSKDFSAREIYLTNLTTDSIAIQIDTDKKFLSLSDLAGFCGCTFPLLKWMYEPVPAKYVKWYFSKIQIFFAIEGGHIPGVWGRLLGAVECFFRCAYSLPSFNFQSELNDIDSYAASKLAFSYQEFIGFCVDLGYENYWNNVHPRNLSLLSILNRIRIGLCYVLENRSQNETYHLTFAVQDIIKFMIYIIDFLFKEHRARALSEQLDLPEGIVLKLHDILNHTFKAHLGVQLPERENGDVLDDFPSYIETLMDCWKEPSKDEI